jgi:hypothetical protein
VILSGPAARTAEFIEKQSKAGSETPSGHLLGRRS